MSDAGAPRVSVVVPTYRDAARALELVAALRAAKGVPDEIVVVDDGSADGSAARLAAELPPSARLVALPENRGRAAARNAGAALATGSHLLFLDCDCLPAAEDLPRAHLQAWSGDVVASLGPVLGRGAGFWPRYQDRLALRQGAAAGAESGDGSAANLMVARRAFEAVGGFDATLRGYGFEDRDLLLRLARHGRLVWSAAARVTHGAGPDLGTVLRKLDQAGAGNAAAFRERHPAAYAASAYARVDARLRPWLRPLARPLGALALRGAARLEPWLQRERVPFGLRCALVRACSALAYMHGTARAHPRSPASSSP